jgi:hypothetical protein
MSRHHLLAYSRYSRLKRVHSWRACGARPDYWVSVCGLSYERAEYLIPDTELGIFCKLCLARAARSTDS